MRRILAKGFIGTAVALTAGGVLSAQQPAQAPQKPPTFTSGTQVVQVDVRAFKDGHFVTDLKPDDFVIKEDGVEQPITNLTLVQPGTSGVKAVTYAAEGSVQPTGMREAPISSNVWVFVFDTAHLSPSGLHNTQKAVVDFLQGRFHQGDIGGVIANGKMANNRLSSVREELVKAADAVKTGDQSFLQAKRELGQWPALDANNDEAFEIDRDRSDTNPVLQNAVKRACEAQTDSCKNEGAQAFIEAQLQQKAAAYVAAVQASAKMSLAVIEGLANGLAKIPGPKTVVYLTEGYPAQDAQEMLKQADGMANRAGAHLYVLDARGLNKGSPDIVTQSASFDTRMPTSHYDLQADVMNSLALDTGGMFIQNENNFERALATIQDDAATYYVLGYSPTNQAFDGKYRTISVEVKRPGVKVRARRGYLALEPAKLLKPVPITNARGTIVADARPALTTREGFAASDAAILPGDEIGMLSAPELVPAATALRQRIEGQGLVQQLRSAERLTPSKAADLAGKGWAAYSKGDVEHAVVYLGQAAQSPETHPWVRYALGLSHLALAQYADAVKAWEEVRQEAPDFEPVYFNLADGYLLQKDENAALKVLHDAEVRWPKDSEVWNAIGVLQVRREALDAAIDSFTKATDVDPSDSLGVFNLARAYQLRATKFQRYDSAMEKWVGGEADNRKAVEEYQRYLKMGGPFTPQAKQALQMLTWK